MGTIGVRSSLSVGSVEGGVIFRTDLSHWLNGLSDETFLMVGNVLMSFDVFARISFASFAEGGVTIYLWDDFLPPLMYLNFLLQPLADALWLRLPLRHLDALLITLLYRSPSSDLPRDCDLLISVRDFIDSIIVPI